MTRERASSARSKSTPSVAFNRMAATGSSKQYQKLLPPFECSKSPPDLDLTPKLSSFKRSESETRAHTKVRVTLTRIQLFRHITDASPQRGSIRGSPHTCLRARNFLLITHTSTRPFTGPVGWRSSALCAAYTVQQMTHRPTQPPRHSPCASRAFRSRPRTMREMRGSVANTRRAPSGIR
jgi:hypothetical protein